MTTVDAAAYAAAPAAPRGRIFNVVRLQYVNRQTFIWVPLIVLGGAFVVTWGIWAVLFANGVRADMYGGGAQAPLWYFAVVGVQALTLTFPFSQAMSVTRREFYLGTLLTAAFTHSTSPGKSPSRTIFDLSLRRSSRTSRGMTTTTR